MDDNDPVGGYSLGNEASFGMEPLAKRPFVFRHMEELSNFPFKTIRHGASPRALHGLAEIEWRDGDADVINMFMRRLHIAGLMVVKDGKLRCERYRYGNLPISRWAMFSVTKSIVSTAVGAAIREGRVAVSDLVTDLVPELRGSDYDNVTLEAALNMSSGLEMVNDYRSDVLTQDRVAYYAGDPEAVFAYLRSFSRTPTLPIKFAYKNIDTFILGEIVRRVTGETLADFISRKIWLPAGMSDDAVMRTTHCGREVSHGGLSMTLSDLARFGLLVMEQCRNASIVPEGWFDPVCSATEANTPEDRRPGAIDICPGFGYARQWWTIEKRDDAYSLGNDGGFAALGMFGQALYVVPGLDLVVAMQCSNLIGDDPEHFVRSREFATAIASWLSAESSAS